MLYKIKLDKESMVFSVINVRKIRTNCTDFHLFNRLKSAILSLILDVKNILSPIDFIINKNLFI